MRLPDNFWAPWLKRVREVYLPHLLETSQPLIGDFEYLAGMHEVEGKYTPSTDQHCWSDMFVHNTLEAMAAGLALAPDAELEAELDRRIDVVAKAQESDGYLQSCHQVRETPHWIDMDNHELFVAGHLMEAAATYHR